MGIRPLLGSAAHAAFPWRGPEEPSSRSKASPRAAPAEAREAWPVVWTVAALAGFIAAVGLIGADALWLVPLGSEVVHGDLPRSIPYATAASAGWHDVPAGAQLVFWALYHGFGGARGLVVAQAAAAAIGFGALARGLRREASAGAALLISMVVLVGSLPIVVVTGVTLFSLALFPVLLGLLESESRAPSRRLWLSVPLLAVWGNLHGEVLVGFALLLCYLVLGRARRQPWLCLSVGIAATAALFANPMFWQTPRYYWGVAHNEVARLGWGLWAPLGTGALDLLLLAAAAVLVALSLRGRVRVRLWEAVALAGLAAETVHVFRTGPWLLFVAAYPAVRSPRIGEPRKRLLVLTAGLLGVLTAAVLVRGPADPGSAPLALLAARSGRPVLADTLLGEQVALAGGRVWVDNPIDAFRSSDQLLYLQWLAGKESGAAAVSHAAYVLVAPRSAPALVAAHDPRLVEIAADSGAVLYRVRRG